MRAPGDAKKKPGRSFGLRARLLIALALALGPVLAVVGFQAAHSYREAVRASQDELLVSALIAGQAAKSTLEKGRTVLTTLRSLGAVRGGGEACVESLQEVNASIPETANVALLDPWGRVICSAQEISPEFSAAKEQWFDTARRGRAFVVSPLTYGPMSDGPVLILATPATSVKYGRARGALALSIRVRAIDREGSGEAPEIALADPTGQILTSPSAAGLKAIPVSWIKRAEAERGYVGFIQRPNGTRGNIAVSPLVGEDIFVVLSSATPTLFSWTRLDLLGRVILPLAMFVLALAAVWAAGDRLVLRWVRDLHGLAGAYAQGDYSARPTSTAQGAPEELHALERALIDMAGRIDARDQILKDAVEEKQTLLREVHHRVKNNLQIMVSLFNMQLRTLGDDDGRKALEEARARVTALALVHQALYEGDDLRTVELGGFIEGLVRALIDAAGGAARRVELSVSVSAQSQPAAIAVPLALFIVEAVTNALKHAFPEDREGIIDITVAEDAAAQMLKVAITDDGVGISGTMSERTGASLMTAFARQLRGVSKTGPAPGRGARVELAIPLTEAVEEAIERA